MRLPSIELTCHARVHWPAVDVDLTFDIIEDPQKHTQVST